MMTEQITLDLRWHRHRHTWVTPPERFRPDGYAVDIIDEVRQARPFVAEHHYEGSMPPVRLTVGLFDPRGRVVGVAAFTVPITGAVIRAHAAVPDDEGCELGRFVCAPSVAFNGESWFLARALRLLREAKPGIRAVVSYADPVERTCAAGTLVKRAHWGTIYQASNAAFAGRSAPRTLILDGNGRVINGRALTKIRKQERGWEGAARRLIEAGAPPRLAFEDPADWLDRALRGFRRLRHPGNLVYVFGVTHAESRRLQQLHGRRPYPKAAA